MSEEPRGKDLDVLAILFGLRRRRWLWIFKERDKTLRARILSTLSCVPMRNESVEAFRLRATGSAT